MSLTTTVAQKAIISLTMFSNTELLHITANVMIKATLPCHAKHLLTAFDVDFVGNGLVAVGVMGAGERES